MVSSSLLQTYITGFTLYTMDTSNHLAGWPNSLARSVATWIARAIVDRVLPSSNVRRPAIVHPPGADVEDEMIVDVT